MRRTKLSARLLSACAASLLLSAACSLVARAQVTLGVMGDSLSDEYQYNGRSYAQNWVEQLATYDHVNLGANVSNLPPRYIGYNQNWALVGATSATVLSGGQASGLAAQIPNAGGYGIDYAVLMIGANDFGPGTTPYNSIYNGTWTTTQINNYVNSVVSNISTALADVLPTGVKAVVATIPDYGITPAVQAGFPDANKRQLVANVVAQVNAGIKATAQADHIVVADLSALIAATFGTEGHFNTTITLGGVPIYLTQTTSSSSSQAGFCSDGIHAYTTLQGTLGNLLVQALDTGYNAGIPLFSESQILSHAGLTYGGSDTLAAQIGPYSNYVISYAGAPPITGDANHDNIVNSQDIALASANWLHFGSNIQGDVNGDGLVNIQDIALMSSNWLHASASSGNAAAVPEPTTLGMALLAAAIMTAARRRKR
jgi:lysophospholipase L1-like esterase